MIKVVSVRALAWSVFVLLGSAVAAAASTWTEKLDATIEDAIAKQQIPGAVVWVGRGDQTVYRKAYGYRAVKPAPESMQLDTVFDLASLTKGIATATSVMILVEEGKLRLSDKVAQHLPEFARHDKDQITVRHLLTHTSGLRAIRLQRYRLHRARRDCV
jgi:serine-type D-Ala-D-Ala carboxypeptidase